MCNVSVLPDSLLYFVNANVAFFKQLLFLKSVEYACVISILCVCVCVYVHTCRQPILYLI